MTGFENDVETVVKQKVKRPGKYNVIMHNDDFTPMDFVVDVLINVFGHTVENSMAIMLDIHHTEKGIAGTYSKEIANEKVEEVKTLANASDVPLQVTAEPAD